MTKVSLNESQVSLGTAFFSVILRGQFFYINKTKVIFNFFCNFNAFKNFVIVCIFKME